MKKRLRTIIAIVLMLMLLSGCESAESNGETKVGDIIFENDTVKITAVDTDEYLEVFKTEEICLPYFASDGYPVVLDLGGSTLSVIQSDEKLYEQLEKSVLTVHESSVEQEITNMLEEFFVFRMSDGTFRVYYEIYNEYDETVSKDTVTKYLNLKAFKIEFKEYIEDLEEQLEFI